MNGLITAGGGTGTLLMAFCLIFYSALSCQGKRIACPCVGGQEEECLWGRKDQEVVPHPVLALVVSLHISGVEPRSEGEVQLSEGRLALAGSAGWV